MTMMPYERTRLLGLTARYIPHYVSRLDKGVEICAWCGSPTRAAAELVREQIALAMGIPETAIVIDPIAEGSMSVKMKVVKAK
jgi:hypothetical protein